MKRRHYINLHKWSGEQVGSVVGWEKFSEDSKKIWLKEYNADYVTEEIRESLV